MTIDTFFEKFELFADAPDAVAKMRELVLELAVRGRLSERRPDDQKELAWQAFLNEFDHRIYGSDPGPPPPFDLPDGWRWVTLSEVVDCRASAKVAPSDIKETDWILDLEDIDGTSGTVVNRATFAERRSQSTKAEFMEGDVLYGKLRPYLNKVVIADSAGFCTTEIVPLRPSEVMSGGFLRGFLRSPHFLRFAAEKNYGMKMPRLGTKDLESAAIPLPPPAEQKRIVAKVDELMALCDRLEAQQQERETRHAALARGSLARFAEAPTPANLQFLFHQSYAIPPADLRKSILTLAVQGKLVPQDPNDEPAEETFHGLKSLNPESGDGLGLPKQWALCTYRALTTLVTSGSRGWKEFYADTGSIFVRTQNIKTDRLVLDDVAFVDLPKTAEGMRAQVLKDDILITITGANVTKAARVEKQIPEAYVSQHIALTRPRWSKMSEWFYLCFISHGSARGILEQLAYGDKPGLNLNNIRDLMLPLPPLAEQRRIVAKVEQLMALVDELESQLTTSRTAASNLLSAMVAELSAAPAPSKPEAAKSNIIQLSTRPEFIRSLLAAEIIDRSRDHETFGQTKLQKIIVLAEYLLELREIDSRPRRFARGPHDPEMIAQVERKMEEQEWFQRKVRKDGEGGWKYVPLANAGGHRTLFEQQWPDKADEIRRLIDSMKSWLTERCERFATVYAAWNDLIHEKKAPTDEAILREVLEHWHSDKKKIPLSKWQETLNWMRAQGHVPTGFGRATREPESGELFPL